MQIDYKKGHKVKITKPGIFNDFTGTIHSIKIEVDLGVGMGTWSFSPEELDLIQGEKSIKVDHKITEPEKGNSVDNLTVATKPQKRSYVKKSSKPKEIKVKRAYHKKPKS